MFALGEGAPLPSLTFRDQISQEFQKTAGPDSITLRRRYSIVTALPAVLFQPDEALGPFHVEPDQGELGFPGRWVVMCHEPRSFDPRYQYADGSLFLQQKLKPRWRLVHKEGRRRYPTREKIAETLASYYGLADLGNRQ